MNKFIGFLLCCLFVGSLGACDEEKTQSDSLTTVSLGSKEFKTLENITPFRIPVILSTVTTQAVTVIGVIKSETNAKEGKDYTFTTKQIVIPAGKSSGNFEVEIKDYPEYTPDRMFEFEIVGVKGAVLSSLDACKVTIMSNEGLPVLGFTNTLYSISEEMQQLEVEVKTDRICMETVSFHLRVLSDKSTAILDEHYNVDTARVYTIPAGDSSVMIPVTIIDNIEQNEDRYFELEICGNQNSVLSEVFGNVKVTILDDEEAIFVCFNKTSVEDIESGGPVWIPVRVNGAARVPVKVVLEVRGGTAIEGQDYKFEQRELVFPVGTKLDSVKIDFIDNEIKDLDRTLQIGFASVEGAQLASSDTLMNVKINNDDFDLKQLYEDLMGEWTLLMPGGANLPASVVVTVSGGSTPAEEDENYLKYLVVSCDKFGEGKYAAKWRLSYDAETGALAVILGEVISENIPFSSPRDIKWDRGSADAIDPVKIYPSKDYKTLKYDPAVEIRGGGYDANGNRDVWWLTMKNAVMVRTND